MRLHIETSGSGSPLVLLHGWGLHSGLFATVAGDLSHNAHVSAVDLPGHGHSDPLRPWTLSGVVDALERSVAHTDQPLTVLGWSLGGLAALAWALRHPGRVDRLVLVSTTPRFAAADDWPHAMTSETLRRFGDELSVAYRTTLLRFLSLQVQGGESGRAALAALRARLFERGEPDRAMLADALRELESVDLRDSVAGIEARTLIVHGDRDALVPLGAASWLAQAMPRAHIVVLEGAAHAPFLSHRAAFLAALQAFLIDA